MRRGRETAGNPPRKCPWRLTHWLLLAQLALSALTSLQGLTGCATSPSSARGTSADQDSVVKPLTAGAEALGGQVTLAKVVRNDDAREIAVTLKNNSSQQVQFIWRPAFFDMQDPRAEYRDELARWQEAFIPSKGSLDVKLTVHLTPPVVPGIVFRRK